MKDQIVLRVVSRLLIPFILLFGFYIQFHGELTPGGGFQAGTIIASAFILYSLVFGLNQAMSIIPLKLLRILSSIGILLYIGVGILTWLMGEKFLNYSILSINQVKGQGIGIFLVEIGIGITVFSVLVMIFFAFSGRSK